MNKIITYSLIILFLFQSTSNFWIMFSFYLNREYIAQELCVNRFDKIPVCKGSCYLGKQLLQNEKKEQKSTGAKNKGVLLYTHIENVFDFGFNFSSSYQKGVILSRNVLISSTFIHSFFQPPKQINLI